MSEQLYVFRVRIHGRSYDGSSNESTLVRFVIAKSMSDAASSVESDGEPFSIRRLGPVHNGKSVDH